MLQTIAITVTGKVQGVFYRQSTKEMAEQLGISGTVENQPDGSVLIIATGTSEQLNNLVTWCYQGPRRAAVTDVLVQPVPHKAFTGFTIQR